MSAQDRHVVNGVELPKGVRQNKSGHFVVAVIPYGCNNPVRLTFRSLADALEAHAAGMRARLERLSPEETKQLMLAGARVHHANIAPAAPVRRLGEIMDIFLASRRAICDLGDHSRRRSAKNGVNSLRPRTYELYEHTIDKHLRPRWGDVLINTIDRESVDKWTHEMAANGLGIDTARRAMIFLRLLVRWSRASEHPEDFPWVGVEAIRPTTTIRPSKDPSKWGGVPGSSPPSLPIGRCMELFESIPSASRAAVYLERFAGLRLGEACGLLLSELTYDQAGVLRLWIRRQMEFDGTIVDYVKTDSSYRPIPVPAALARYLDGYCLHYHGYDLHNPDPEYSTTPLIVNSAGRDVDGRFLPINITGLFHQLIRRRPDHDLDHATIGFTFGNHYFRMCFITEMLNAEPILANQLRALLDEAPVEPEERLQYLERLVAQRSTVEFQPMHVSSYAGHRHDSKSEADGAAAVTLQHYNLSLTFDGPWLAIRETMDRFIAHEVGALEFVPDEIDTLPVHPVDDHEWLTAAQAADLIGINISNAQAAVRDGRLDGHLGWQANGGYLRNRTPGAKTVPAVPQLFVSAASVKEYHRQRSLVRLRVVARRFGMSDGPARSVMWRAGYPLVESGWNPDHVDIVHAELHRLVLDAVDTSRVTLYELKRRIDHSEPMVLPDGKVTIGWLTTWCDQLQSNGQLVRNRKGEVSKP